MQFARDVADPALGTSLTQFMNVYLKVKYTRQPLNERDQQYVAGFLKPFLSAVRAKVGFGRRISGFLNPVRCAGFFTMPEDEAE
jgi:hypothetical protein